MTPEQLKASILQYAIQGRLVEQYPNDEIVSIAIDKLGIVFGFSLMYLFIGHRFLIEREVTFFIFLFIFIANTCLM